MKIDKKISKTKGITLVALIITIVVMLILVGVSIQVVINSDLIGTAQDAANRMEIAYAEEGNLGGVKIGDETYNSIEEYFTEDSEEITVESITITGETEVIQEREIQLTAEIEPSNAVVTWTSSDEGIATVDSNGKVTGVTEGTVEITAMSGGKEDKHEITVIGLLTFNVEGYNIEYKAPSTWTWSQFIADEEYNVSGWVEYNSYIYESEEACNTDPYSGILCKGPNISSWDVRQCRY